MNSRVLFGLICALCLSIYIDRCHGSAWLMDPPSRSASWYYGIRAPINYEFRNLDCGGELVTLQNNGSRNCGICGDPISESVPRDNENGGTYAKKIILTRFYEEGDLVEFSIWNNVPKTPGFYEFRLCTDGANPGQACLDANPLFLPKFQDYRMTVPSESGLILIQAQLPSGVTCDHCLLQWRFRRGDTSGCNDNNWCGLGRGPQVEYYNCADVMIGAQGSVKPPYIQDPTYTSEDYGSAYGDWTSNTTHSPHTVSTERVDSTTPSITTVATTTGGVITVPTAPTGATTVPPLTTPDPGDRLVVANVGGGGSVSVITTGTGQRSNQNALLLLLGLLPLIGAASLSGGSRAVPEPAGFLVRYPAAPAWNGGIGQIGRGYTGPVKSSGGYGYDKLSFGNNAVITDYPAYAYHTGPSYKQTAITYPGFNRNSYAGAIPSGGGIWNTGSVNYNNVNWNTNVGNTIPVTGTIRDPPETIPQRVLDIEPQVVQTKTKYPDIDLSTALYQKNPTSSYGSSWMSFNENLSNTLATNNLGLKTSMFEFPSQNAGTQQTRSQQISDTPAGNSQQQTFPSSQLGSSLQSTIPANQQSGKYNGNYQSNGYGTSTYIQQVGLNRGLQMNGPANQPNRFQQTNTQMTQQFQQTSQGLPLNNAGIQPAQFGVNQRPQFGVNQRPQFGVNQRPQFGVNQFGVQG